MKIYISEMKDNNRIGDEATKNNYLNMCQHVNIYSRDGNTKYCVSL